MTQNPPSATALYDPATHIAVPRTDVEQVRRFATWLLGTPDEGDQANAKSILSIIESWLTPRPTHAGEEK